MGFDHLPLDNQLRLERTYYKMTVSKKIKTVDFKVVKGISGRGVRKAGRGYMNKQLYFSSIL